MPDNDFTPALEAATNRVAALKEMEKALRYIAVNSEYPPPPNQYLAIQSEWRKMVTKARKAVAKMDALTGNR